MIFKIRQNHATSIPTYSTSSTSLGVLHLNHPYCKCKCNVLVVQYNVKWKLKISKVWQGGAGSGWLIEWSFILYLVLDTSLDLYSCVHGIEGKCRYLENLFDTSPHSSFATSATQGEGYQMCWYENNQCMHQNSSFWIKKKHVKICNQKTWTKKFWIWLIILPCWCNVAGCCCC